MNVDDYPQPSPVERKVIGIIADLIQIGADYRHALLLLHDHTMQRLIQEVPAISSGEYEQLSKNPKDVENAIAMCRRYQQG